MRYEAYAHTRDKLMELASGEKARLVEEAESVDAAGGASLCGGPSSLNRGQIGQDHIEMEKRRLEKVAKRQQKELLRMLVS